MGRPTPDEGYTSALSSRGIGIKRDSSGHERVTKSVTTENEQRVKRGGLISPLVDPRKAHILRSLVRFDEKDGKYYVTVGCPMPIRTDSDTTGSMGSNVDYMTAVLPRTYETAKEVTEGYDLQFCYGVMNDFCDGDSLVLQRTQYEMSGEKIANSITELVPGRNGGDWEEDQHYAAFDAAYLTDAYINRIGLKGYYFCITDAPSHGDFNARKIERIFGDDVWKSLEDNGCNISRQNIPDMDDVYDALKKKFHAFLIIVGGLSSNSEAINYWRGYYGRDHIISVDTIHSVPQVVACAIGITEGTLLYTKIEDFLRSHQIEEYKIPGMLADLSRVPFGAQKTLAEASGLKKPIAGDVFSSKSDLQPESHPDDIDSKEAANVSEVTWL